MKKSSAAGTDVLVLLNEVDRQATILERAGKRQLKEAARMRQLRIAMQGQFQRLTVKHGTKRER